LKNMGPRLSIKSIHNTVADGISQLGYDPSVNQTAEGMVHAYVDQKLMPLTSS
jgi:hypothetical protein